MFNLSYFYERIWGDAKIIKSVGDENNQTKLNPISKNKFDFNYYVKKYNLYIYDTSKSFLHNYLSVLNDVSFLVSYSAFMREKVKYNFIMFGLIKSVDYDKTFTQRFREIFYGYGGLFGFNCYYFY